MSEGIRATLRPVTRAARTAAAWSRGLASSIAGAPSGAPVVGYGQRIPSRDELAVGGIIKLQELQHAFAESALRFNVLYLVTSRLPDGAVAQARWARRKGAKVVLNQNGVAYPAWYGEGWQRENEPIARLLEMADHVFYQSAFCKLSADRFAAPRAGSWEVLFNAVDTRRFSPAVQAARPLTLLLAGSQDVWYRLDTALQVLALVSKRRPDARLLVTGRLPWHHQPDETKRQADARVLELGIADRVTFLGPCSSQADAPDIYRRADILVHTKYNDPCPGVVIEAMASGLPVVYSRSGGVPELVGDAAGIGIPAPLDWEHDIPPDPGDMAAAVLAIADRQRQYADAARQRAVSLLDIERWIARHRAVFEAAA